MNVFVIELKNPLTAEWYIAMVFYTGAQADAWIKQVAEVNPNLEHRYSHVPLVERRQQQNAR